MWTDHIEVGRAKLAVDNAQNRDKDDSADGCGSYRWLDNFAMLWCMRWWSQEDKTDRKIKPRRDKKGKRPKPRTMEMEGRRRGLSSPAVARAEGDRAQLCGTRPALLPSYSNFLPTHFFGMEKSLLRMPPPQGVPPRTLASGPRPRFAKAFQMRHSFSPLV